MPLRAVTLPCTVCGGPAVQITQPPFSAAVLGYVKPALKLAPMIWPGLALGRRLELPPDGDVLGVFDPAELSSWLQVTCAACAVFPPALVYAT